MFSWFYFAHHPLCKNYSDEVLKINDYYFCRGCSEVYGTALFIILFSFFLEPIKTLNIFQFILIGILSIIPSFIGNIIHFKHRLIKDILRIILGLGLGIGVFSIIILPDIISKLSILLFMAIMYFIFKISRSNQESYLCPECTSFTDNACASYKRVFKTEGDYSRILSDYIQKRISLNKMAKFGFGNSHDEL